MCTSVHIGAALGKRRTVNLVPARWCVGCEGKRTTVNLAPASGVWGVSKRVVSCGVVWCGVVWGGVVWGGAGPGGMCGLVCGERRRKFSIIACKRKTCFCVLGGGNGMGCVDVCLYGQVDM